VAGLKADEPSRSFSLPDHVRWSQRLQYLGRTFGYLRRGARSVMDVGERFRVLDDFDPIQLAKRFHSRFSALSYPTVFW